MRSPNSALRRCAVVVSLTPGGPAASCGLHVGDTLLGVNGVTIDEVRFYGLVQFYERTKRVAQAVCEAHARTAPVFMLWYEDMVADTDGTFNALQRFLRVPPRTLNSNSVFTDPITLDFHILFRFIDDQVPFC